MLPPKITKASKRASRWRSAAHCNFVRSHACCMCGSTSGIEVAHVRIGSGAGMSQKPDDWRTVSLCSEDHRHQHTQGERIFWTVYTKRHGQTLEDLLDAFCKASPKAHEIREKQRERGL